MPVGIRNTAICSGGAAVGNGPPSGAGTGSGEAVKVLKKSPPSAKKIATIVAIRSRFTRKVRYYELRRMSVPITIRPYDESDVDALTEAARESIEEVSPWLPWCHPQYSAADAIAWIRTTREACVTGDMHQFAIIAGSGQYAGGCGINEINRVHWVANLGYWVRSSLAGQGIAPAAVRELARWAFEHTTINRLEIVVAVENVRSQRVAEKARAHRDALMKKRLLLNGAATDAVLYSIIRPD